MKTLFKIISIFLLIDFVSFIAWVASGQVPVDGVYFGMITANFIKFILF